MNSICLQREKKKDKHVWNVVEREWGQKERARNREKDREKAIEKPKERKAKWVLETGRALKREKMGSKERERKRVRDREKEGM